MTWESTTSDADPVAGKIAWNHATIASATVLYVDDADDASADITSYVQSWDDVSNSTARGIVTITKEGTASTYAVFKISGAITDASGYTKVPVTHVVSSGSFSDNDGVGVHFQYSGIEGTAPSFIQEGTNFTNSLLIGHSTTGTLSSAENNTGVGIAALDALTSGDNNTAVGRQCLTTVTTGQNNTAIGQNAAKLTSDSEENVAVGYEALMNNATGDMNTAVGSNALYTTTAGHYNTALGRQGLKLTTGDYNTGLGYRAGDNITSGDGNVIIGSVDAASATGDRQLKIAGYDGTTTTTWISGSSSGVVTLNAANVTQQAITSSSNAVAWDASAKPNAYHITTENTTFSAPSNGVEGAFISLELNFNGSHTIGWNTVFEFAASTEPTETATDAKTDIHIFRYNGAVWQEVGRTLNLSES